ncbi:SLAM family member 8-like [Lepisosteus oculatus]|uniref:SLAM family member 8-like n=1 Tax=Lepisosteus oculatus TaxID=7918 RepID=UPI0007401712|nr:PREDICTED: SLAM family member 8-like [Lepisosteus oculatus]
MAFGGAVLLFLGVSGACLSVSQSEEKQQSRLTAGESFTFPDAIILSGHLKYTGLGSIITVQNNVSDTDYETSFRGRVYWDSRTGQITITNLTVQDSGEFELESTKANRFTKNFILKIYKPVSKPQVWVINSSCTAVCSVEMGPGVNMAWNTKTLDQPQVHNNIMTTKLDLKGQPPPFKCSAWNPADMKLAVLSPPENCTEHKTPDDNTKWIVVSITVVAITVLIVVGGFFLRKKRQERNQL